MNEYNEQKAAATSLSSLLKSKIQPKIFLNKDEDIKVDMRTNKKKYQDILSENRPRKTKKENN